MIFLIEPNTVNPPCKTFCTTLCATKCVDMVYPLYGIKPVEI